MITFKAYENGSWHVTDQVQVDANDSQDARFYNKKLRLVSAAQCVRAAMDDGSNVVLMSLRQDLKITRAKVAEVSEMLSGGC